jgi:hypothetical protein
MPFTSGSRCAATKLYSLTVVMPDASGASAPPFIFFSSSEVNCPTFEPGPMAP